MNLLRRLVTTALVALVLATCALPAAHAAPIIDWMTVGDAGNANDPATGGIYGGVADEFRIMKYEFTNQQYTDFLNSVDPSGTNPNSVYSTGMGGTARGGITNTGTTNGSRYAVKSNMGDKPVNYVSWFDAARVSNWLMNGATGTSSMETGAYTLNNATSGTAPAVNSGAMYFVPTENQWYKAAYYKGSGTNAGYWQYATQITGTAPTAVNATTVGTGTSSGVSPVTSGNFANYNLGASWNSRIGNVTTVGTNGGPSAYNAFDMGGNVNEWNGLTGVAGSLVGARGGDLGNNAFGVSSSGRDALAPSHEDDIFGFRLASPVAVPEPSTWVMGLAGIACGGWQMWRRRRARALGFRDCGGHGSCHALEIGADHAFDAVDFRMPQQ
jgi:formylglycine-generating enzyme